MPYGTLSEMLLEQLRAWGVKRIYGFVGDSIFELMNAVAAQTAIRWISVKHESAAAFMASAEAKLTGKLAVCAAHMGPGIANLLSGLGDAAMDGYPVLAITGQAPLNKIGTPYKQLVNQQELVRAFAGSTELVVHPDAFANALSTVGHASVAMGTVSHLSIPADLFAMPANSRLRELVASPVGRPETAKLDRALQAMRAAERPMIVVGEKAREAAAEIKRLAEIWGSGIVDAYGATGVIPYGEPLGLGGVGEGGNPELAAPFSEADVVLAVDTSWWPEEHRPNDAYVIQIAGRQTELGAGIPADCGVLGDGRTVVGLLADALTGRAASAGWLDRLRQCKTSWMERNEREGNAPGFPLHPSRIVRAIERCAAEDAIVALDEGDSTVWFLRNFRAARQRILLSGRWRTMGFGLPAAIAAKLCHPQRQVLCVTGDGGLGMAMAELLTASRYGLAIVMVVFRNDTLQMERNKMQAKRLVPDETAIANPDFVKLAEACGWDGFRAESPDELEDRLRQALTSARPVLIEVPTAQAVYADYPKS